MKVDNIQTDEVILAELGKRLAQHRIDVGLSQAALSEQAGVSKRTVERIEAGATSQTATLVRILRVLDLLGRLDVWIPEAGPRPMDLLKRRGQVRKRAPRKKAEATSQPWQWRDDT